MQAIDRHEALSRTASSISGAPLPASGSPTRPRSTSSPLVARCGLRGFDRPDARIRAGQPDRPAASRVDRRHQPRVDRSGQHRDHDLQRRFVGDAQAVDLMLRNRRLRQRRVDLLAAAVHDDQRRVSRDPRDATRAIAFMRCGSSSSSPPSFRRRRVDGAASSPAGPDRPTPLTQPRDSSSPHITLKFCTADPAAPFNRLSMTDTTSARPVGLVHLPADVAEVRPRRRA